jgi:ATP-dependent Clp protease ATP-binding subunit ClpA
LATQQVLAYAAAEARRLGHTTIAPVHLLLGILDDEESLAYEILKAHGITSVKVRAALG